MISHPFRVEVITGKSARIVVQVVPLKQRSIRLFPPLLEPQFDPLISLDFLVKSFVSIGGHNLLSIICAISESAINPTHTAHLNIVFHVEKIL